MEHEIFLYPYSKAEAGRRGELDRWEESFRANVSCAREIEAAIRGYGTIVMDSEQPQGGGTSAGGMAQGIQAAPDFRKTVFRP